MPGSAVTATSGVSDGWWARFRKTRQVDRGVAWRRFGQSLAEAGRGVAAIDAYRRAARRDPVDFPARHGMGRLLRAHRRYREAKTVYRELLTINPHDAIAAGQLGHILVDEGHTRGYHEAEGLLRRAVDLLALDTSNQDAVLVPLCRLLAAQEREREILALTEGRDSVPTLLQRGQTQAALGDFDGARASLQRVISHEPANARAWYHLAGLKLLDGAQGAAGLAAATDPGDWLAAQAPANEGESRVFFAFAAAYALENAGRIGDAWPWYREANAGVREDLPSNVEHIEDFERRTIRAYTAPVLNRLARGHVTTPGPAPVFVVGMPRSGTTLMERIIGAHPQAAPLGERADLREIINAASHADGSEHRPWPERAAHLHPYTSGAIAGAYLARVNALARPGTLVAVDKMPEQFQLIGLIAAAMPQARIIHMTRDPRDVGLSCYTARFHDGLAWSFDLESIARRQASHDRVMAHWRSLIPPGRMLDVVYEDLVAAPVPWVARVLDFLELDWDPACVTEHGDTREAVRTSSMGQVRSGISMASVGRWRRFGAARLEPLVGMTDDS